MFFFSTGLDASGEMAIVLGTFTYSRRKLLGLPYRLLVELALAERDSIKCHAFVAKTMETADKNRGDFHCMQMSLVMSMRYIFGDD